MLCVLQGNNSPGAHAWSHTSASFHIKKGLVEPYLVCISCCTPLGQSEEQSEGSENLTFHRNAEDVDPSPPTKAVAANTTFIRPWRIHNRQNLCAAPCTLQVGERNKFPTANPR